MSTNRKKDFEILIFISFFSSNVYSGDFIDKISPKTFKKIFKEPLKILQNIVDRLLFGFVANGDFITVFYEKLHCYEITTVCVKTLQKIENIELKRT
ncbi:hypothetical protein BpHYR1_024918 [Brachionus plicatilis]|uniref:Uncharacterized protein n=1 Tax=Brachionus plicatilis TaxID=10195 RepID=A0A3M7RZ03_BRAPC|nr:hypothetical protein BpHYR1_024918 [Brachionus plicatilis]